MGKIGKTAMTIDLEADIYNKLELIARANDAPMVVEIHRAILNHIEKCGSDKDFHERFQARLERETAIWRDLRRVDI